MDNCFLSIDVRSQVEYKTPSSASYLAVLAGIRKGELGVEVRGDIHTEREVDHSFHHRLGLL